MELPIVLGAESAASGNLLQLLLAIPEDAHLSADRAPVARSPGKLEFDPTIARADGIPVEQQWSVLIGDDGVKHAAVPKVRQRDGASVVHICDANQLGNFFELAGAVVQKDFLLLISGETTAVERRPVRGVRDDRLVASGDF